MDQIPLKNVVFNSFPTYPENTLIRVYKMGVESKSDNSCQDRVELIRQNWISKDKETKQKNINEKDKQTDGDFYDKVPSVQNRKESWLPWP